MGRSRYSDFFLIKDNLPITNSASFSFHDAFDFKVDMDLFRRLSCADDRPFFGLSSNFDFNWRSSFFSGTEVVRLLFFSIKAPPAIPSKSHLVGADAGGTSESLVESDV